MVEIGESSFIYLQIFYNLYYGIPLLSYKILCWVIALILHLGVLLRTIPISKLNLFSSFQMSSNNATLGSNPTGSFSLMNLCGRVIFDGSNFMDWIRNIRMVTRYEDKEYVSTRS